MNNMMSTSPYNRVVAKGEGMIADPDEFEFVCSCKKCQTKYRNWKALFEEQQSQLRERSEVRRNLEARQQED
jgi:hypothetical protein